MIFCLFVSALLLCSCRGLFSATLFASVPFVGDFTAKNAPTRSAQVLPRVPTHRRRRVCLMEKIRCISKPCPGMSYSVVGCEFHVNEPTTYIKEDVFSRNTHKTGLWINGLIENRLIGTYSCASPGSNGLVLNNSGVFTDHNYRK